MKKENKRMAQEKRAQEREKLEKKQKLLRILAYWGPVVLSVIVVVILVVAIVTSGNNGDSQLEAGEGSEVEIQMDTEAEDVQEDTETGDAQAETQDSEAEEAQILSTEAGLEAKNGDTVNIDFTGKVDGKAFDGGSTDGAGYDLELGSGAFIDGFESGIVGHKVGETFDLNLRFPDKYHDSSLAGKDVVFTTTLNGIYQ